MRACVLVGSVFALACALVSPKLALAEGEPDAASAPSADLRGLYAPLHPESGLTMERVASPDTWDLTATGRLSYAMRPVALRDPNGTLAYAVVDDQVVADFGLSVGFARRVTAGVDVPVLLAQGGDRWLGDPVAERFVGRLPPPSSGLGDPGLRVKLSILSPEVASDGSTEGFGLALDDRFTIPIGDERNFLSEGNVSNEARLLAEYGFGDVVAHARVGSKVRGDTGAFGCDPREPIEECTSRFGHELPFGAGVAVGTRALGFDPEGRGTLFAELRGWLPLAPVAPFDSAAPAGLFTSVAGAVRVSDEVRLFGAFEAALTSGVGSAPFRATLGLTFAPRSPDADGDGLADASERCPDFAEDRDNFEDGDGCPELDNDADGVADLLDRCPDQRGNGGSDDTLGCPAEPEPNHSDP
jgi:OOP family OmpA-OmpF porin